jgi:hypothetical protein
VYWQHLICQYDITYTCYTKKYSEGKSNDFVISVTAFASKYNLYRHFGG